MKRELLKIILLLLAVSPLWITIVALANTPLANDSSAKEIDPLEQWKSYLNAQLLKVENQRIQILEIIPTNTVLESEFLGRPGVKLDLTDARDRGVSTIKLHYHDEMGRLIRLYPLSVRLYIQRPAPVAAREIRRGQTISVEDVRLEWRDSSDLPRSVQHLDEIIGSEAKSYIAKASVIDSGKLNPKTLIRKGDRVSISVVGKGLSIQGFGVAQEGGVRGQTIRLLNPESKKAIYGVIVSAQRVEVRL